MSADPEHHSWLERLALASLLGLVVFVIVGICWAARAEEPWQADAASAYGRRSWFDWGYWPAHDGYIGRGTPWRWECQTDPTQNRTWATFTLDTRGVANRWLPLGTWVEVEVPRPDGTLAKLLLPVIDRGPYAWWSLDLAEGVVLELGWDRAGPPPTGSVAGERYFNRRAVRWRPRPDLERFCPRQGFANPAMGLPVDSYNTPDPPQFNHT